MIQVVVPTMRPPADIPAICTALRTPPKRTIFIHNTPESNLGVLGSLQRGYELTTAPVIAYLHDDVTIHDDGWLDRVSAEFADPMVGIVGFGGALRHGLLDIYKTPYRLAQLGRDGFLSNMDDAEVHGERFNGVCDVAVVDGFAIGVRRRLLAECGGWPVDRFPAHHNYDYLACCLAHRYHYRVRLVGVRCNHAGGSTATSPAYQEWASRTRWGSDAEMHRIGHQLIYDEFVDVLPWACAHPNGGRR